MKFRAEFTPQPFDKKIRHSDKLFLMGSCFTEQIGKKLNAHKFAVTENPNGILFNPVSIARALTDYATEKQYVADELFYFNEAFGSWDHHTKFSKPDQELALEGINNAMRNAAKALRAADTVFVTLGSAFVYERVKGGLSGYKNVAANCHKMPASVFSRRLLAVEEVKDVLAKSLSVIKEINNNFRVIFTISPVRHLREGFIDNNRSKATLITAVHDLVNQEDVLYFPAYELVIDDLRDYRFFAEDLAHPNYAATDYVWEKFVHAAIDPGSVALMKRINEINAARAHKPFNETSSAHKQFLQQNLEKIKVLQEEYPYTSWENETEYFAR